MTDFTLQEVEPRVFDKKRYAIIKDGKTVGHVARTQCTWERKTAGRRYVNARGRTLKWKLDVTGVSHRITFDSRKQALETLQREIDEGWVDIA